MLGLFLYIYRYGNDQCLRALVHDIKRLEENGVSIETSDGEKIVHFIMALITGDNLGLNTVLGFTSSFNHNFFCRFCKAPKSLTQKMSVADPNLTRDKDNYEEDVIGNNVQLTGIKEQSIFNEINSFHVTSNFAVDILHDISEGVCHYDMCHIINHFIKSKYFSLETLNARKYMFNYGEIEIDHRSPKITKAHLANFKLKMTAREMLSFVHLFLLMVGDLVPEDDHVWLFMLDFLEIIDILLSNEISHSLAERMRHLIRKHNQDYVCFFNDTLKPKHHLMLHYFNIVLQSGPPRFYWTFRFESKHKEFKTYARNITSRKNICVSLAKKYQLKFACMLFEKEKPENYTVHGCIPTNYKELIRTYCNRHKIDANNYNCYSECAYNSKKYKKGYFISQYIDHIFPENVLIYEIMQIVLFSNPEIVHVICKRVRVKKYLKHFAAFAIDIDNIASMHDLFILDIKELSGPPINAHKTSRGTVMIQPKQYCF